MEIKHNTDLTKTQNKSNTLRVTEFHILDCGKDR